MFSIINQHIEKLMRTIHYYINQEIKIDNIQVIHLLREKRQN